MKLEEVRSELGSDLCGCEVFGFFFLADLKLQQFSVQGPFGSEAR